MYGGYPKALFMTPAEIMDKWWRYLRVRDERAMAEAVAMRTAFGAELKDWKRFALQRRPMTQEIDPPEKPAAPKQKVVRRKGRKLTMEEVAAQED